MNSWNNSTAPAYNMKVYKVIPENLQNKVFELMDCEDFYDGINDLIHFFDETHNHNWQAGFNGRSGGYLVLYQGGLNNGRPFSYPGRGIETEEVPENVLQSFKELAENIVSYTIDLAKNATIEEEQYTVTKTRKVISC
jgi:hypothetical protein